MRIVFLSTNTDWGGSENLWAAAAFNALQLGHQVQIYAHERMVATNELARLASLGAKVRWWHERQPKCPFWIRLAAKILKFPIPRFDWWRENFDSEVDIICINQGTWEEVIRFPGIVQAVSSSAVPYICLARSDSSRGGLNDELRNLACAFYEKAVAYIGASESTLELARLKLPAKLKNACVLHSPIRDFSVSVREYPRSKSIQFACVGRLLCANKGQDLLLKALSSQKWADRDWTLTFFGEGPDWKYLVDLAQFFELGAKVKFAGKVQEIGLVWASSHALVQPSIVEGLPQSMLEAMLCRRPVIATAVGGISKWVEDGKTGFLAPAPKTELIEECLERAWEARDSWEEMGECAREKFLTQYESDPAGKLLEILLHSAGKDKN